MKLTISVTLGSGILYRNVNLSFKSCTSGNDLNSLYTLLFFVTNLGKINAQLKNVASLNVMANRMEKTVYGNLGYPETK